MLSDARVYCHAKAIRTTGRRPVCDQLGMRLHSHPKIYLAKYQEPLYQGFGSRLLGSSPALKTALKARKVLIAAKTMGAPRITTALILTGIDVVAFSTTK